MDVATKAGQRDQMVAVANGLAEALAARPSANPGVHVNISVHVAPAVVKDSSEAPGGKEIIGGDILSTAGWAPRRKTP